MKSTIVIKDTGKISLILTSENDMEKEILKKLSGSHAHSIQSKVTVLQNSVEGGLLITNEEEKTP